MPIPPPPSPSMHPASPSGGSNTSPNPKYPLPQKHEMPKNDPVKTADSSMLHGNQAFNKDIEKRVYEKLKSIPLNKLKDYNIHIGREGDLEKVAKDLVQSIPNKFYPSILDKGEVRSEVKVEEQRRVSDQRNLVPGPERHKHEQNLKLLKEIFKEDL